MTTKWKIIFGFTTMILLLGIVAAIGYFGLSGASNAFGEYRLLARLNVSTSDIMSNQYASIAAVRLFRIDGDPKLMTQARNAFKDNANMIKEAKTYTERKDILKVLDSAEQHATEQQALVTLLEKNLLQLRSEFTDVLQPIARECGDSLVELSKILSSDGSSAGVNTAASALNSLAYLRSSLNRFVYMATPADGTQVEEMMASLGKALDELGATLNTDAELAALARLKNNYGAMVNSTNTMLTLASAMYNANTTLMELNIRINTDIMEISKLSNDLMVAQGTSTLEQNATSQTYMLGGTIAGLIFGILLSVFIILGLIRVLHNLGVFANAIASGDFQTQVTSREKGEIGAMLSAMRQIPQVLERLIIAIKTGSGKILIGEYRTRLDAASFSGSFSTLAASVNATCDSYLKVLDAMPLAIFTGDPDHKILFANDMCQKILGGEKKGLNCGSCFNTSNCGTSECFANKAMQGKHAVLGEVAIKPATGMSLEITVTALPLLDEAGNTKGFMEICTDITESKQRQRVMHSVSEQAASISSRIAAASEELSAQVEQVARGAEMQRDRVESTASAMTEMNSTVLEVAKNSGQASEQSELTRNKAKDGAGLVNNVVQSINTVNKVAVNLQTNMRELGAKAENIGGVMNIISDIADQTNLLALNAAIEAARAGEAGRGFAVVADEVRKLAEKTMSATQEVGTNITAIQNSARTNISEVNEAAKAVTEATELANTSGQALTEIVELASANSSVVTSIATAAEEQSATSEEINHAIDEINRIVGETAEGMVQSSAAVQELSQMAQELNKIIAELNK
ncbi:MAG: methyl-accepting chemotaxis protein [Deltaproteobacteria bacterium]|jgi:methyl-accepting chemotaxis protein|nr:methyl-accepting chemotaxis protein [Deltaproteobacteria bacterium]